MTIKDAEPSIDYGHSSGVDSRSRAVKERLLILVDETTGAQRQTTAGVLTFGHSWTFTRDDVLASTFTINSLK
jgi:hypothetical protein